MVQRASDTRMDAEIDALQRRLDEVSGSWSAEDYRAFVTFYSRILPDMLQAERCTIFIMHPESRKICSIFGTGLAEQQIEPPLDGSIVGQVIRSGVSRVINNLDGQPGYHIDVDEQTGFTSRQIMCAPIRSVTGQGISGAIQILNKKRGSGFSTDDLSRLEEIAHFLVRNSGIRP